MQDWPYEIADPKRIDEYFTHYNEQTDEDKKFILMEMLIQALTEVENNIEFEGHWERLRDILKKDFEIHEYTVFYWSCIGKDLINCWKITGKMRNLWFEIKKE